MKFCSSSPIPSIRVVSGDAAVVDPSLVLEGEDAGLGLEVAFLDREASVGGLRGVGVRFQVRIRDIWKKTKSKDFYFQSLKLFRNYFS